MLIRANAALVIVAIMASTLLLSAPRATAQDDPPAPLAGCIVGTELVDTQLVQSECDALGVLYDTTGGANWTTDTGWATPTDPCTWHGVTCDDRGLTSLILFNNNLDGPIPPELAELANLRKLRLFRNKLSGEIPAALGELANLRQLWLRSNQLTGEIPLEIGNLAKLNALRLYGNELSGEIPAELGALTKLRVLHLYDNQLSGPIPAELGQLTNLRILRAHANRLRGAIPPELGQLAKLESLHLYDNNRSSRIPAELGQLSALRNLRLEDNRFTGEIPAGLAQLARLRQLRLQNNLLAGDLTAALSGVVDTLSVLELADGVDGNDCLTTDDADLAAALTILDTGWDECSSDAGCEIDGTFIVTNASQGDCDALAFIYFSFGGPEWPGIENWFRELDPCRWTGVTCDERGVIELALESRLIVGPLSPGIGDLEHLEKLDLSSNALSGPIPAELGQLSNLHTLELRNNLLTGDLTPALSTIIGALASLDLSDGPAGNDCFIITNPTLVSQVSALDSNWDECD